MTRVEFYFNVPDKALKAAELCEKAVAKGRQVTLFVPDDQAMQQLQDTLWQGDTRFLPSAKASDVNASFAPIVLDATGEQLIQDDVLINLQLDYPPFFSRFRYLVEMVGTGEEDKAQARTRFRFYRDRGYTIKTTDMAETAVNESS